MRLSGRKGLLRAFEALGVVQSVVAISIALLVLDGLVAPASAQPIVMTNFMLLFPTFAVAVFIMVEFTNAQRVGQSWWQKNRGLSLAEMKALVRWCPPPLLYLCLGSVAAGVVGTLIGGGVHWSSHQEFTSHHAVGFSLGTLVFCSLAVLVLASASRMPGEFINHVGRTNETRI